MTEVKSRLQANGIANLLSPSAPPMCHGAVKLFNGFSFSEKTAENL